MKKTTLICGAFMIAAATLVSGCIVQPARVQYRAEVAYPDYPQPTVVANIAPPPVQYEVVGVPPQPGFFWISGVWLWEGGRHVWHGGHWAAPRPGYAWVPHRWHQEGDHWHMDGGHWQHH